MHRKNFNAVGGVSHLQVLLPEQYFKMLAQSLRKTARRHSGIAKMVQETRQKCYFHSIASYVRAGSASAKNAYKKNA